jgi:hypothetical protein
MNVDLAQELLDELGSSIENLETQHAALLQFLKEDGVVTDDQFAPYLAQAGHASSVRWRATRIRLEHLLSAEKQREEQLAENEQQAKDAKTKNDDSSGETAAQGDAVDAKTLAKNEASQSSSEKDSKRDEQATGEDKQQSAKQEKDAA